MGQTGHLGGSLRVPSIDCLLDDFSFSSSPGRRMVLLQIRSQGAEGRRCLFWSHREEGAAQVQTQALWPQWSPSPHPCQRQHAMRRHLRQLSGSTAGLGYLHKPGKPGLGMLPWKYTIL